MAAQGGRVTFASFMDLALTHPTDGYYSQTETLLGPEGHFSTAPRLSEVFNQSVGRLLEELVDDVLGSALDRSPGAAAAALTLIELGAGEGDLAKAVLEKWQTDRPDLRGRLTYMIVEVGEQLRARQRQVLKGAIDRGWRVVWAGTVAEALAGVGAAVIVGNEFIDALPVHLVNVRGKEPAEAWVELDQTRAGADSSMSVMPRETWGALSEESRTELEVVFGTTEAGALRALTRDGIIELRPSAGELMRTLATGPPAVCLLTVDYGEWFAGSARDGSSGPALPLYGRSLRGYFRHQLVTDPYVRVGRQDLTADVDFRALDLHGQNAGFETVLFTTVADLLCANGGEQRLEALRREAGGALEADRQATVLEGLVDAQGLGGAFKVMLQVRG